jgi:hypothetical protein
MTQRCAIGSLKLAVYLTGNQTMLDLVDEAIENVRQTFFRSPRKSINR